MIARIDEKLSAQVNEILHAPEFQQIESAWRGLHYLVFNSETDANLKIRVMNVSKSELYRNLRLYPGARWDQSPLFKTVYEAEFGQLGGEPFGCVVGDYYFSHLPTDVQLLRDLSKIAGCGACAVLRGGRTDAAGHGHLDRAVQPARPQQGLRHAGLRGLESPARLGRFALCRTVHAARAVAPALRREVRSGRGVRLRGGDRRPQGREIRVDERRLRDGGQRQPRVQGMGLVHPHPRRPVGRRGHQPADAHVPDRRRRRRPEMPDRDRDQRPARARAGASSGLIPLIHRKNTDKAAFIGAQSVYKPKKYFGKDGVAATASDNLSARLPYMFAVSRFAHYLKCMVRDKIGSMKEKEELQRWLQEWINEYVDGDPANSTEDTKARKPLADARVEVFENEENPGYYSARSTCARTTSSKAWTSA